MSEIKAQVTPEMQGQWDRWFRRTSKEFKPLLEPYAGKKIVYVEIGTWAGACAEWVARNILTHPESLGIGIDPYPYERKHNVPLIKQFAAERLDFMGGRWQWFYSSSHEALKFPAFETKLMMVHGAEHRRIDVLYIDGNHDAHNVVTDFALAWPFLAQGSLVIFDDYTVRAPKIYPNVREGYHAIMAAWAGLIEPVKKPHRQGAVRVVRKEHGK